MVERCNDTIHHGLGIRELHGFGGGLRLRIGNIGGDHNYSESIACNTDDFSFRNNDILPRWKRDIDIIFGNRK